MLSFSVNKIPSDILMETARKHKALRKSKKITQQELAERSGVSLGSIKRFENTGLISFLSLLQLAQILGRLEDFETLFNLAQDQKKLENLFSNKVRNQ